jgi:hypothetical protein
MPTPSSDARMRDADGNGSADLHVEMLASSESGCQAWIASIRLCIEQLKRKEDEETGAAVLIRQMDTLDEDNADIDQQFDDCLGTKEHQEHQEQQEQGISTIMERELSMYPDDLKELFFAGRLDTGSTEQHGGGGGGGGATRDEAEDYVIGIIDQSKRGAASPPPLAPARVDNTAAVQAAVRRVVTAIARLANLVVSSQSACAFAAGLDPAALCRAVEEKEDEDEGEDEDEDDDEEEGQEPLADPLAAADLRVRLVRSVLEQLLPPACSVQDAARVTPHSSGDDVDPSTERERLRRARYESGQQRGALATQQPVDLRDAAAAAEPPPAADEGKEKKTNIHFDN